MAFICQCPFRHSAFVHSIRIAVSSDRFGRLPLHGMSEGFPVYRHSFSPWISRSSQNSAVRAFIQQLSLQIPADPLQ